MHDAGKIPEGLEIGNAWELRSSAISKTNWFVGEFPTIPEASLRFMRQSKPEKNIEGMTAKDIAVKWFVHSPDDPEDWGENKPTSAGRTMSILAGNGEFKLIFIKDCQYYTVTLDAPGDFVVWGPGLEHSWKPIKISPILTVRWNPD